MIGKEKILLIATFVVAFVTYSFWEAIKEATGVRIFYGGVALSFVGYTYLIHLLIKRVSRQNSNFKELTPISYIVFLATFNNLVDELLFDPTKLQVNEYIGFIVIIALTYFNGRRNDTDRKKRIL